MKRICSLNEDLNRNLSNLKSWFLKRNYPESLVTNQIERSFNPNTKNSNQKIRVPLVIIFCQGFADIGHKMYKHLHILGQDEDVKKVFDPPQFVSYRTARNLKSHLVRAKVYPMDRNVGSAKCKGKICLVCDNMEEKMYKINHRLTCNSKCVVYLLSCKICGIQYVGQTTNKFRLRWNNYRDNARKAASGSGHMQGHLFAHFNDEYHNGFLSDCMITLIDKKDGFNPQCREQYWIRSLKTISPLGLNLSEVV